jgi:putative serine protease PepD
MRRSTLATVVASVDSSGRVIGITSSIAGSARWGQSGSIGLGFAIPINEGKQVADEPRQRQGATCLLGVTLADDSVALDGAQREAAVIRTVGADTPAAKAGVKTGDAVIAINGQPIGSSDSLIGTIRALKPGTQVTLVIIRNGKSQQVVVTLAQRPTSTS